MTTPHNSAGEDGGNCIHEFVMTPGGNRHCFKCAKQQPAAESVKPCNICTLPLAGVMIGDGDGTGQKFAHPDCYYKKRMEESHRRIADLERQLKEAVDAKHDVAEYWQSKYHNLEQQVLDFKENNEFLSKELSKPKSDAPF